MQFPRFLPFGDAALLVEFGEDVDRAISEAVIALDERTSSANLNGIVETTPSFRSLMIQFDPLVTDAVEIEDKVTALLSGQSKASSTGRLWRLPACYAPEFGLDQAEISRTTGLSVDEIIRLHNGQEHHVYMIGFLPGHPYMGDLPDKLNLPRRADPRVRVPPGSIAIAIGLTVVYPVESPGGWNIVAKTPVPLFSTTDDPPALLGPGDKVRFEPIDLAEFDRISKAIERGDWSIEPEVVP